MNKNLKIYLVLIISILFLGLEIQAQQNSKSIIVEGYEVEPLTITPPSYDSTYTSIPKNTSSIGTLFAFPDWEPTPKEFKIYPIGGQLYSKYDNNKRAMLTDIGIQAELNNLTFKESNPGFFLSMAANVSAGSYSVDKKHRSLYRWNYMAKTETLIRFYKLGLGAKFGQRNGFGEEKIGRTDQLGFIVENAVLTSTNNSIGVDTHYNRYTNKEFTITNLNDLDNWLYIHRKTENNVFSLKLGPGIKLTKANYNDPSLNKESAHTEYFKLSSNLSYEKYFNLGFDNIYIFSTRLNTSVANEYLLFLPDYELNQLRPSYFMATDSSNMQFYLDTAKLIPKIKLGVGYNLDYQNISKRKYSERRKSESFAYSVGYSSIF